jgi:hypothetical protein
MSTELNLLPCPFCGASADSGNGFAPLESVTYAYCENSNCPLHTVDVGFTPETWNRRTPLPVQAGEGEANAVREARARLEQKWDSEGSCGSCGWHALLAEHYVDDVDIAEALTIGNGWLELSCISKDDEARDDHRGVRIYIGPPPVAADVKAGGQGGEDGSLKPCECTPAQRSRCDFCAGFGKARAKANDGEES